jgi:hypothetical protein
MMDLYESGEAVSPPLVSFMGAKFTRARLRKIREPLSQSSVSQSVMVSHQRAMY